MRGVCFQGIESVRLQDLADPRIELPSDAIVRVEMAGLCGSDLHPYFGREPGLDVGTVMGHEFVGNVVEIGTDVTSLQIGQRVFAPFSTSCGDCFYCLQGLTSRCVGNQLFGWRNQGRGLHGGQAEFVRVPLAEGTLVAVPPGLSFESALLLGDNFSTGYYCAELAQIQPEGVYCVIGCGTVGLMAILAAGKLGAQTIVAVDPIAARRKQAESMGALVAADENAAIDLVRSRTNGRGADGVMELVGLPAAQRLAYQLIRPGGVMSVIGCHCAEQFAFSPVDAYNKNLVYKTGRCPARYYMGLLAQKVATGWVELDSFITHRFRFDDCTNAYDVFANRKEGCLKAVFTNDN
jgi:2-desacetyl-2-hydroxyethyl bacteriochlorophyllide A dehydrogenase